MAGQQPKGPKLKFIDRPEVRETFTDSVRDASFDGQTLRLEFCVTRVEPANGVGQAPSAQQFPVARLVLSPAAIDQLVNDLENLKKAVQQANVMAAVPNVKPN